MEAEQTLTKKEKDKFIAAESTAVKELKKKFNDALNDASGEKPNPESKLKKELEKLKNEIVKEVVKKVKEEAVKEVMKEVGGALAEILKMKKSSEKNDVKNEVEQSQEYSFPEMSQRYLQLPPTALEKEKMKKARHTLEEILEDLEKKSKPQEKSLTESDRDAQSAVEMTAEKKSESDFTLHPKYLSQVKKLFARGRVYLKNLQQERKECDRKIAYESEQKNKVDQNIKRLQQQIKGGVNQESAKILELEIKTLEKQKKEWEKDFGGRTAKLLEQKNELDQEIKRLDQAMRLYAKIIDKWYRDYES